MFGILLLKKIKKFLKYGSSRAGRMPQLVELFCSFLNFYCDFIASVQTLLSKIGFAFHLELLIEILHFVSIHNGALFLFYFMYHSGRTADKNAEVESVPSNPRSFSSDLAGSVLLCFENWRALEFLCGSSKYLEFELFEGFYSHKFNKGLQSYQAEERHPNTTINNVICLLGPVQ